MRYSNTQARLLTLFGRQVNVLYCVPKRREWMGGWCEGEGPGEGHRSMPCCLAPTIHPSWSQIVCLTPSLTNQILELRDLLDLRFPISRIFRIQIPVQIWDIISSSTSHAPGAFSLLVSIFDFPQLTDRQARSDRKRRQGRTKTGVSFP